MAKEAASFVRSMLDLVFPPGCPACDSSMAGFASLMCELCRLEVDTELTEPACPICGSGGVASDIRHGQCGSCRSSKTRIAGTVRVGSYSGILGPVLRGYKYQRRWESEPVLSALLAQRVAIAPWVENIDAVVAVPSYWVRRLARDVYPAEVFAAAVARRLHKPFAPVLRRIRGGRHQIGLSYTQRRANVKGAFALRPRASVRGVRLLLVDDVKTTGATLDECTRVLLRCGASSVYAGVLLKAGWLPGSSRYLSIA